MGGVTPDRKDASVKRKHYTISFFLARTCGKKTVWLSFEIEIINVVLTSRPASLAQLLECRLSSFHLY